MDVSWGKASERLFELLQRVGADCATDEVRDVVIRYPSEKQRMFLAEIMQSSDGRRVAAVEDVVLRAIGGMVKKGTPNALAAGYSAGGLVHERGVGDGLMVDAAIPSTAMKVLTAPRWQNVLDQVGEPFFGYLLSECTILVEVRGDAGSSSFVQVTGPLDSGRTPQQHREVRKRRVLYKRSASKWEQPGPPTKRFRDSVLPRDCPGPSTKASKNTARVMVQRIFLEHRALHRGDSGSRGRLSSKRIPKRLVGLIPLMQQFSGRARASAIWAILNRYCPIAPELGVSENEACLSSATFVPDSYDEDGIDFDRLWVGKEQKRGVRGAPTISGLVDASVGARCVSDFVTTSLRQMVPIGLFGSVENRRAVEKWVRSFVHMRRGEGLDLDVIANSVNIAEMRWLRPTQTTQGTPNPTNRAWESKQVVRLWSYIFGTLVVQLIGQNFYATEAQGSRHGVIYYRIPVWRKLTQLVNRSILTDTFRVHRRLQSQSPSGVAARIRILPKPGGFRVLQISTDNSRSLWTSVCKVLHHELRIRQRNAEWATVSTLSDIQNRMRSFHTRWAALGRPKLHTVAFDLAKAFDSIRLDTLMKRVLPPFLQHRVYAIVHYLVKTTIGPRLSVRSAYHVCDVPGDEIHFLRLVRDTLSRKHPNTVLLDLVSVKVLARDKILNSIYRRLSRNTVLINGVSCVQLSGIPQGLEISPVLATVNYAFMEMEQAREFVVPSQPGQSLYYASLYMRMADDFLFVSSNQDHTTRFCNWVLNGNPNYGASVNPAKSKASFDLAELYPDKAFTAANLSLKLLPWCGIVVDTNNMEVFVDYDRYLNNRLSDTLTVSAHAGPGLLLEEKAKSRFNAKIHGLFLDVRINSTGAVALNVYQMAVLCCMKLLASMSVVCRHNYIPKLDHLVKVTVLCQQSLVGRIVDARRCADLPLVPVEIALVVSDAFRDVLSRQRSKSHHASAIRRLIPPLQGRLWAITPRGGPPSFKRVREQARENNRSESLWKIRL